MLSYTYLAVLVGSFVGPFVFSFLPRVRFYRNWGSALFANTLVGLLFVPWDSWFTSKGVWGFSYERITKVFLFGLPLEECLFFLVIPFACLFVYECITSFSFFPRRWYIYKVSPILLRMLSVLLLLGVFFVYHQWYTTSVLVGTAVLLFVGSFSLASQFVQWGQLLLTYLVVCIPFLIVNGVLTSLPVVWYNSAHFSNLRVGSIPLEDFLYYFMLLFTNVLVYRIVRWRRKVDI